MKSGASRRCGCGAGRRTADIRHRAPCPSRGRRCVGLAVRVSGVGGLLDQSGNCQCRHISNIGIIETTTTTDRQHGGDPLQVQIPFLDRQRASHAHHGGKLIIRQAKHVPDDAAAVAKIKLALGINPANVTARAGRCPRLSREPLRCGGGNCADDRHQSKNAHHPAQK